MMYLRVGFGLKLSPNKQKIAVLLYRIINVSKSVTGRYKFSIIVWRCYNDNNNIMI